MEFPVHKVLVGFFPFKGNPFDKVTNFLGERGLKGEKGSSGEGGPIGPAGPPGQTVFQTADGAFNHSCMCTPGPPGKFHSLNRNSVTSNLI